MGIKPVFSFILRSNLLALLIFCMASLAFESTAHGYASNAGNTGAKNGISEVGPLVNGPVVISPFVDDPNQPSGAEFEVIIQANDVDAVAGAEATLSFNASLLELVDSEPTPAFAGCFSNANERHPGNLRLVILCQPNESMSGVSGSPLPIWTVTFRVSHNTGEVVDMRLSVFDTLLTGGQVPPQTIPSEGDTTDLTLLDGVCGDQDDSGVVDVFDAVTDLLIIVEMIIPSPLQELLSDVVIDGDILITDVVLMLKQIADSVEIEECGLRNGV